MFFSMSLINVISVTLAARDSIETVLEKEKEIHVQRQLSFQFVQSVVGIEDERNQDSLALHFSQENRRRI